MTHLIERSPTARVAHRIFEGLARHVFLRAYEVSDDFYWRRYEAPQRWQDLAGIVEYSADFLAVTRDGAEPVYLLTLRAASNAVLQRVRIKLKVKKGGCIHQEELTVDRLDSVPVRQALMEIPLKPKRLKRTKGVKLGDVYIKLVEATDSDGEDLIRGRKIATIFGPTCTVSALDHYEQRWGQYWNIDQMTLARQLIKNLWYRRIVQSAGQLWRPLRLRRGLYWLLTNPAALAVQFWAGNLRSARRLKAQIQQSECANPLAAGRPSATQSSQDPGAVSAMA
jgi:hypothetical protein